MKITRRAFGGIAAGMLAAPALAADPVAAWPNRPVRVVVPFGAGGMVAGAHVATQPADGYTLMAADIGANVIGKELNPKASYDPMTSFTPLMHLVNLDAVMVANPSVKQKTVEEIVEAAKKDPDGFVYSSAGIGNGSHLFMALLSRETGIRMVHVPYRSGSETVTAVMRGDAQFCFPSLASTLPMLKGGQVRPVALGAGPSKLLSGVPLMRDTIPGFEVAVWYGLAAPAGMEPVLADKINSVFAKVAALPDIQRMVEDIQGGRIVGGSRQDFAAFLQREYDRWTPVIREGGIRMD